MLVLSRQRDESIIIGDNIIITIVDIRGDKVRLGIEAPVNIPVHRQEVYDAIQRENPPVVEEESGLPKIVSESDLPTAGSGKPDSTKEHHSILSLNSDLSNDYVGLGRLTGSYSSLRKELMVYGL